MPGHRLPEDQEGEWRSVRTYVKSAGHKASQDYVWRPADASGNESPADRKLLSEAERRAANRGRVAAFACEPGESPHRFALFFGNVDSGRRDFYGTPILNRIGFVFDAGDDGDGRAAANLAADWYSGDSVLEKRLSTGIPASDAPAGFAVSPDFAHAVAKVAGGPPQAPPHPDVGWELFSEIARMARRPPLANGRKEPLWKGNAMKIFVNTTPSVDELEGETEYGWHVGGRPAYGDRLSDICGHAITADIAFYAALSREPSSWVVFIQDIIGRDLAKIRPARGTIAIEISDSDANAAEKARRLLHAWLLPGGGLLAAIKSHVDVSGEEVKADMPALLAKADAIGTDPSIALGATPLPQRRTIRRIAKDLSNIASLRREAAEFVAGHSFPAEPGVHFLFTHSAYSADPRSCDAMPSIPAKYIVAGHRDDEPDSCEPVQESAQPETTIPARLPASGGAVPPPPKPGEPPSSRLPVVCVGIAIVVAVLLLLLLRNRARAGEDLPDASGTIPARNLPENPVAD